MYRKGVNRAVWRQYYVWAGILPSAEGQGCRRCRRGSCRLEVCSLEVSPPPVVVQVQGTAPRHVRRQPLPPEGQVRTSYHPPLVRAVRQGGAGKASALQGTEA